MSDSGDFFVEVDCSRLSCSGQRVSGDVCLHHKTDKRIITVMSNGSDSGIKANAVASVIASMIIGYARMDEDMLRAVQTAVGTFARGGRNDDMRWAAFTIIDVTTYDGRVRIVEFGTPGTVVMRGDRVVDLPRRREAVTCADGSKIELLTADFAARVEDRITAYTDGVVRSGSNTRRMPGGWGADGVVDFLVRSVRNDSGVSAAHLARSVTECARTNDLFEAKNDMSCCVVYFRRPRKVLVVTGPAFDGDKDGALAEMVRSFDGNVIVSGGTTARILSRELGRELSVVMRRDVSGLPPESVMEGCALVTEGVLTLRRVKGLLETMNSSHAEGKGLDARYVRLLLEGDEIDFVVGTRVNSVHHDPKLPVEIELRRSVIKDIARVLENKFMKRVRVTYV